MMSLTSRLREFIRVRFLRQAINQRIRHMEYGVERHAPIPDKQAIIFFNASTRLAGLSLNAAFSLLSAWSLRLQGVPIVHFVCGRGLSKCVLGTGRRDVDAPMPCNHCIHQSQVLYQHSDVRWFEFKPDHALDEVIMDLNIEELKSFEYTGVPLGALALPSVRWTLRRHHLNSDTATKTVYHHYIRSAWYVKKQFGQLLDEVKPQSIVVFNGMQYPEATARWVAEQRDFPVYSHEVGIGAFSAFFTRGEATAYPVDIPEDFQLSKTQNEKLDAYLSKRFKGDFSMAGIQFWPEMSGLDMDFLKLREKFKQVVPVFTNVIFDTSQPHANVVFPHMFAWLDSVLDIAKGHPETLFVIRAHPDESRPGKVSQESVADWAKAHELGQIPNVVFIGSNTFFSSYEMIQRAKFIMIYNSTIGMEASIMGTPVLCAGKARFTQLPTVFFPLTQDAFLEQAEIFLKAKSIDVPQEQSINARRFLYYQLYRTSLPFGYFLEEDNIWNGFVKLRRFDWKKLLPANSPVMQVINDGLLNNADFLLKEE
ncbi:MAG: hypothetical protein ABIG43_07320 [Chloroflexota bacterium]